MDNKLLPPFEIFRAGFHVDDAGVEHRFSEADLAATAAAYDPGHHEAPIVIGHPEHDQPAHGWVESIAVVDGRLVATPKQVDPKFAEQVAAGRYKKRSASFYPPGHPKSKPGVWSLRHVGFLGARPPAVAGLRDFAEGDAEGVVSFSEANTAPETTEPTKEEPNVDEQLKKELEEEKAKTARLEAEKKAAADKAAAAETALANFAEQQKAARHADVVAFCEGQVKAGKLLPKDKTAAVAALDTLSQAEPVSFAEGEPKASLAEWLKGLIASSAPKVHFGEFAGAAVVTQGGAQGLSDAEIDRRAKAYAAEKSVSYADALTAVVSFTQ